jgi:hypothetical protein
MPDIPIPVSFRAEIVQQVVSLVRAGESCALIGVGSSGKSNIARHLARADVRQEYFGPEAEATLVVYLNCKPFARKPPAEFYLHALDQLTRALDAHGGALAGQRETVNALWQAAQAGPPGLALRNLDEAIGKLVAAGAAHLILALDDCDDLLAYVAPEFFSDLRGLRDNYKVRLVYMTLTRREPAFLRQDTPEFEELFELLSAPGHTLGVTPYVETDALLMLQRLAARQVPPRALTHDEARRLYVLAGGHAGLLRSMFFATQYNSDIAAASLTADGWERLASHPDVEGECRKIWDSLEEEEQEDLQRLLLGQTPSADGLRRLDRRGLVRLHLNQPAEFFAPVFERCVGSLLGLSREDPPAAGLEVEFTGVGHQARVNGELVTNLLAPEFEILRCLSAVRPEPCPRLALIESMRNAEQQERSRHVQGDPLRRLEEYVRQLRAKLGPAGHLIQPTGDGYKLG